MVFRVICSFFCASLISTMFSGCLCIDSDSILAGQSLFPNQTIISQGRKFELGFFSLGNTSNYYVGIWYKNIPVTTVVWVANRNSPISYSFYNDSRLEMSKDGNLQLIVNSKRIWELGNSNATEAVILDTGNFVGRNGSDIIVWQSFDYPTDTWLPGGYVGFHWFSDVQAKLVSWKNTMDPGSGNYSLEMEPKGGSELFIKQSESQRLWRSGFLQSLGTFNVLPPEFNNAYNFTYFSSGDSVSLVYNDFSNETVISRIVISPSGILTHLIWSDDAEAWNVLWAQPSDACKTYAICGSYAICNIGSSPICSCLNDGFAPRAPGNWVVGDFSDGCVRISSTCSDESDFSKISNIRLPANPEPLKVGRSDVCEFACATNCLCNAYAYSREEGCLLFMEDLLDLEIVPNGTASRDLYVRMVTMTSRRRGKGNVNVPRLALIVPISVVAVLCSTFFYVVIFGESAEPKGELLNGQFVAVKRLSKRSGQGLEEFKNEIELIAKLQHRNLVGILGCCIENDEKILVYEYMPNKSLDFFLLDPTKKELLEWGRRVSIIEGIAQGLLYLHHYSRLRIVHRDLKASNILLDGEMNPKISDFGMARIFGGTDLQANTKRIVGTYGYMSPEYAMEGIFSIKSDVYAFGVLMLEIISGKKNNGFYGPDDLNLLGYAWNMWTNNRGLELIDPALEIISSSSSIPLRYIQIGLLCVQENPGDRPTMLDVVAMLNKEQTEVTSPKHPVFCVGRGFSETSPGENQVEMCSVNDVTVSLIEAR